jgi:hypothetical protein
MTMIVRDKTEKRARRGSAAVVALVAVTVLVGLCGAMLMIASRTSGESGSAVDRHQATSAAHAGLAEARMRIAAGDTSSIGSIDAPLEFGGGTYWVEVVPDEAAGTCTVTAFADVRGDQDALQVLLAGNTPDIYDHALFAGNTSGDPLYALKLGGLAKQADLVNGDVYSGGSVEVNGDATVLGDIRAQDDISGASGESGVSQPVPDIAAMDYPNTADFKVDQLFAGSAYKSNALGGKAWQVAESNPAHIFRKNPSDRSSDWNATTKQDYFLEDPYEPVQSDNGSTGADACALSLSGISGEPGANGNHKVYFIDGNLWVHNRNTFSFEIEHEEQNGVQVTFVAKGNIYFSDNVFYQDTQTDGVAFIAMKDSAVQDSGNIYFGDPVYGTLEQMHAFMYAENNFIDKNLSASGSAEVAVYGNMTAGNKVDIQRDYGPQHSKLTVNYDARISLGSLDMPGLPRTDDDGGAGLAFRGVRRVAFP